VVVTNFGERAFLAIENRILKPVHEWLFEKVIEQCIINPIERSRTVQSVIGNEGLQKLLRNQWSWIAFACVVATSTFISVEAGTSAWLGWVSMCLGIMYVTHVVWYGRIARRRHLARPVTVAGQAIRAHRFSVAVLTGAILVGVLGIEVAVRKTGGGWGDPSLVRFHLALVLGMAVTFGLARFKFTGLENPGMHRRLVYPFVFFYFMTFITGTWLIFNKFPPPL
jgi:hypothetical protein